MKMTQTGTSKEINRKKMEGRETTYIKEISNTVDTQATERMHLAEGRAEKRLESQKDAMSFKGGLGISNIQHINATQQIKSAERKENLADSKMSEARRAERNGDYGRANSLKSEASSLRGQAKYERRKGERAIAESKKK